MDNKIVLLNADIPKYNVHFLPLSYLCFFVIVLLFCFSLPLTSLIYFHISSGYVIIHYFERSSSLRRGLCSAGDTSVELPGHAAVLLFGFTATGLLFLCLSLIWAPFPLGFGDRHRLSPPITHFLSSSSEGTAFLLWIWSLFINSVVAAYLWWFGEREEVR